MAGGDQEILVGSDLYISANETEITEGDSIQFTIRPIALGEDIITIYINNVSVHSTQSSGSDILYVHTFNESGEFSVYAEATYNNIQTQPIVITVEEANITLPTSQVSWEINSKNVQSIFIDNKEVQSIVMENSGNILFQKSNDITNLPIMTLTVTGSSFSTYSNTPFTFNDRVFVDWGDDTGLIEYTNGELTHTYSSSDNYTVKIYGDITSLESNCFRNCIGLTSIVIPNSVTSLKSNCFYNCTGLTSINVPNSVSSIGDGCFYNCTSLTSIVIPSSITSLGSYCFDNCTGLTSIEIPNSVTSLGNYCFRRCLALTSITIPSSVTSLGNHCFHNCTGLTSINIPDSVSSIGDSCFYNCSSLTSISVPNSVTSLENYCFRSCTGLTSIKFNWDTSTNILTYNSNWINDISSNLLFHIPSSTTSLYTAKGYPLEKLEEELSDNIMELEIAGNSFSTYSSTPFTYTGRVFVDWGDDTGLIEYVGGQLTHTYSYSDVYTVKIYGDITSLGNDCFRTCTGLISIVIPSSVTSLQDSCFLGCRNLTSIENPNSITSLGSGCFSKCTSLTSIIIPNSVTSLGSDCFSDCFDLASITLPNNVTSLGEGCFSACSSLTSINIPNSVTNLGEYCFYRCTGLTSIILNWDTNDEIITYNQNWITNASSSLLFCIPNDVTSLYTAKGYPSNKLIEMYDEIELTTDKSILSYADNETCTLTAQLLKESTPFMVSGLTVEFFNGTTSMGTAQTNSNGVATITYSSTGNGDVVFSATGNNLTSEPITVEDYLFYDSLTVDKGYWSKSESYIIANFTENGLTAYKPSNTSLAKLNSSISLPNEYEVEVTVAQYNNNSNVPYWNFEGISCLVDSSKYKIGKTNVGIVGSSSITPQTNDVITFKKVDGTITISVNGTELGSKTVNSSGWWLEYGTNQITYKDLKIKPLPVSTYDGISLTADKSVLSYADGENVTLTAQLTYNNNPAGISGQTIEFFNGLTSMGTVQTNSQGIATISYSSTGVGDVVFSATGNNLTSQPVTVEDCLMYDATEYNKTGTGSATSAATNNKSWDNTIDWELTTDIKVTGNACRIDVVPPSQSLNYHLGIGKASNGSLSTYIGKNGGGEENQVHSETMSNNTYYTVKVVKEGTTIKFYYDDSLIRTNSTTATSWIGNYSTESVKFTTWASNTIYMKNLKVKPLGA